MVDYDDVSIGHKVEFEFLREGLEKNELAIYLTRDDIKQVKAEMMSFGIDVHNYEKKRC
jgi:hypothetical protein